MEYELLVAMFGGASNVDAVGGPDDAADQSLESTAAVNAGNCSWVINDGNASRAAKEA